MFEDRYQITENLEKYAHTITEIEYPIAELQECYEEIKEYAVDYSTIRERAVAGLFSSIKTESIDGREYLDIPAIKNLVNMFNPVTKDIGSGNIAIVVYKPGFIFHPHTDFSRKACIMFPIYPNDAGAPIDFYKDDIMEGYDKNTNRPDHTDELYLGSHFYSNIYPTITNTEVPHGVRNDSNDIRVQLQFSIYDDYDLCIERIKSGEFLNV